MTSTSLTTRTFGLVSSVAFLTGMLALLSVANGIFAMTTTSSGGGVVILPSKLTPAVDGPTFTQGQLYGAAPELPQSYLVEKITLGILLILLGYALHAIVSERDRRVAVHARRRTKARRR